MSSKRISTCAAALLLLIALAPAAIAQTRGEPRPPTREELMVMIDAALPAFITEDNSALVRNLQNPVLGDPPSKSFDRAGAVKAVFGRLVPTFAPDCKRLVTTAGEPDPNECMASRGSAAGGGAFTALEFSKHPGFGNFNVFKRPADTIVTPASLRPVIRSDDDALKLAMSFLTATFGLSSLEMPHLRAGEKLPVRTLFMNFASPTSGQAPGGPGVGVQKHVFLQRQAMLNDKLGPAFVSLPGRAVVLIDDQGVQGALVDGWGDVVPDPSADPRKAKGRRALVNEMADVALQDLDAPVDKVMTRLHLEGVLDGTRMLLLPAVQMWLAPMPDDLSEAEQAVRQTTAGNVHDFMLVGPTEGKSDAL